jgi:predicted phosphodiesterase
MRIVMGSDILGAALSGNPKVTDVYCGHSHWPAETRIGRLLAVNVGSTYTVKGLRVLQA